MKTAIVLFLSYLIGAISGSYIIGKLLRGTDIREHGSGNAGTTNAIRVMGKKLGYLTFFIDVVKGVAVMLFLAPLLAPELRLFAGVFVVLGHDFPFYLRFRGGKGIATTLGAWGILHPVFAAVSAAIGVICALATRYVSVGSMCFLSAISIAMIWTYSATPWNVVAVVVLWILGFVRHRSNIDRLRRGTEKRIGGNSQ